MADFREMRDLLGEKARDLVETPAAQIEKTNESRKSEGCPAFPEGLRLDPRIDSKSKQRLLNHTSERRDADIPLAQAPKPQVEIPAFVRIE